MALALLKLFQKFPKATFESRLSNLTLTICNAMRCKDSKAREIARSVLAKMSVSVGLEYFGDIVHELSLALGEGYQLHIRSSALHACLLALKENEAIMGSVHDSAFMDSCVPAIMDLIQQDIFGTAAEMKEAKDVTKRVIKEAMGVKSYDTLELLCTMTRFRPSMMRDEASASAVHNVVGPLIARLQLEGADTDLSSIGKVKECLNKAVIGWAKNADVSGEEVRSSLTRDDPRQLAQLTPPPIFTHSQVLKFVYATISGVIGTREQRDKRKREEAGEEEESSEEEDLDEDGEEVDDDVKPMQISGAKGGGKKGAEKKKAKKGEKEGKKKTPSSKNWLPSEMEQHNQRSATLMRREQKKIDAKVLDGASAPILTGTGRHGASAMAKPKGLNNPAVACAVTFGLGLLNSALKKGKLDWTDDLMKNMAAPYVPMLTKCVRRSQSDEVVLLSIKCLNYLLKWDLDADVVADSKRNLSSSCLRILTKGGIGGAKDEIVQGCFKALTFLFQGGDIDLNPKQMRALVGLLHSIVHDTAHHNSTFALIASIVGKKFVNIEMYELMDTVLKLVPQSSKDTVRQRSGQIFYNFLINYPLGEKQFET